MPDVHSNLGPSSSHRWLNCPGSVELEKDFPGTTSEYAEAGTVAHSLAELKLNKYFTKGIGPKKYKAAFDRIAENPHFDKSMDGYTDEYFDYIKGKALEYKNKPFVSVEERVDFSQYVPGGFGTADCIMISDDTLIVIDFKYGKGVKVDPERNSQLMLYALGAFLNYSFIYNIQNVEMHIVQPRIDNIGSYSMTAEELLTWADEIAPIAKEAFEGSDKLSEGEWCKFCRAKSVCKARAEKMFEKVEVIKPFIDNDLKTLVPEEFGRLLKEVEGLEDWVKDLKAQALEEVLAGHDVPGYKAVEGRSNRTFKDVDCAFKILMDSGVEEALLYERKPITLTAVEKLIGKHCFSEFLKDEVVKPKGKPTLVKESDKRPNYNPADDMFKKLEKEGN